MAVRKIKATIRPEIKIVSDIRPGSATPAQKIIWHKFWKRLVGMQDRDEDHNAESEKSPSGLTH
jgi:hypothetical protein